MTTVNRRRAAAIQNRIVLLEQRIAELKEKEDLERLRPPVNGHRIMAYLGMSPGPKVGEIMQVLLEKRIDEGPYSEHEALTIARKWALDEGLEDPGPPPPA